MKRASLFAIACLALLAGSARADGNAEEGKKVFFKRCVMCHSLTDTARIGPYLKGVIGRSVASAEGYAYYSDAMEAYGATGAVWDEAKLDEFLQDPLKLLPGIKMRTSPLSDETERADLIAFLKLNR